MSANESVKVAIRWRPLIKREGDEIIKEWELSNTAVLLKNEYGDREWTFDRVFDESSNSENVYQEVVSPIVSQALEGYNGTVFAYGQTGSGKTFTMRGTDNCPGIIPLAVRSLLDVMKEKQDREFMMAMIYIEIYNEKIKDLLCSKEDKKIIITDKDGQFDVEGVEQKVVATSEEIMRLLALGDKKRATAATNMNEHSSRSHAIFRLTVESRDKELGMKSSVTKAQINLVDLAGSEKAAQTGATGQTLKEGANINRSLFMLGRVINELTSNSPHISYRDSALTRILQPALGGNAKTAIIATATRANIAETKSTMLFAHGAKKIQNKTRVNESMTKDALIHRQQKEISELQKQMQMLEDGRSQEEGSSVHEDSTKTISELEDRIRNLQKLVINNNSTQYTAPKVIRRQTVCLSSLRQNQFERPFPVKRQNTATTEEDDLFPEQDENALDRIDQDRELNLLQQIDTNKRVGNKRNHDYITGMSPMIKRHKSLGPNMANIQPTIAYLEKIEFDELSKENFPEFKAKVRSSMVTSSNVDIVQLTKDHKRLEDENKNLKDENAEFKRQLSSIETNHESEITKLRENVSKLESQLKTLELAQNSSPEIQDSLSQTKLMAELEDENLKLQKQMEEMVTKYEMKEKITLKQLNERLDILGDNKTVEQLVNQTKSIHAQLLDKARIITSLEEKNQLKESEIQMLKESIEDFKVKGSNPDQSNVSMTEVNEMKQALVVLQNQLVEAQERSLCVSNKEVSHVGTETDFQELIKSLETSPGEKTILMGEAVEYAETVNARLIQLEETLENKEKQNTLFAEQILKLQEQLKEATEELAFVHDERKCQDGVIDDITIKNSSLKDQLAGITSISDQGSLNATHQIETELLKEKMMNIEAELKSKNEELKKLESVSNAINDVEFLNKQLLEQQKITSTWKLKVDMAEEKAEHATGQLDQLKYEIKALTDKQNKTEIQAKTREANLLSDIDDLNRELASQWNQKENMPIVERSIISEEATVPVMSEEVSKEDGSTQIEKKSVSDMEIQVELETNAESELKDIKVKLELLREQAEGATEWKEKTDLALQEKSSECDTLQSEIGALSDKFSALEKTNSQLESQKSKVIAELENYKKETTELIVLKTTKMDELQLEINSLKELSSKHEEDHADEVEILAMKITSLEEKLEDNLNMSSFYEKAKQELECELAASKSKLQQFNTDNDLMSKQLDENELKIKKLEENILSLQSTEALLITERSKMILELQNYKDQHFIRPTIPEVKSPQKEKSSVENQLSKSEMEELGIAEESTEDIIGQPNPDVVLSDGDEENVDNVISQYEVVSIGVNTDYCNLTPVPRVPVDFVSIGVNTEENNVLEFTPIESESPIGDICLNGLFTPPQIESQNSTSVQVEMISIGIETDPVKCTSMAVNTSFLEHKEKPEMVSSGINTSIMTSPENIIPVNCSFGVNTSFQVNNENDKTVEEIKEQLDASKTTELQLLSKLEDLNKQLGDSKTLASSLEDKNKLLLGDNQTHLAAQLDFRSRVEELEVQISQLKQSHQVNLDELQEEKNRLMKNLEEVENDLQNLKTKMSEDKSELERVNLNIAELQDQLSVTINERDTISLELNNLKEKCSKIDNDLLVANEAANKQSSSLNFMETMREELNAARSQRTQMSEELKSLREANNDKDSKLELAAGMFQKNNETISKLQEEKQGLETHIESISGVIKESESLAHALTELKKNSDEVKLNLTDEINSLKRELEIFKAKEPDVKKLEEDLAQLLELNENREFQMNEIKAEREVFDETKINLEKQLEETKTDCVNLAQTVHELNVRTQEQDAQIAKHKSEMARRADEVTEKRNKIAELQSDILKLQSTNKSNQKDLNEIEALKVKLAETEPARLNLLQKSNKNEKLLVTMRDDLRKHMEEIEKLEENERKLQIDLNNQIIARNEAVSSLNTVKANLGVFKDEYKKMEDLLKTTKEDKSNLSNKINSLQITIQNGESELTRLRKERDEAVKARDERKSKYDRLAQVYMDLKKKNTDVDEIKDKLKKYYKLYQTTVCGNCQTSLCVSKCSKCGSTRNQLDAIEKANSSTRTRSSTNQHLPSTSSTSTASSSKPNGAKNKEECKQQ